MDRVLPKGIECKTKRFNMAVYSGVLLQYKQIKDISYSTVPYTSVNEKGIISAPFKTLNKNVNYAGLQWRHERKFVVLFWGEWYNFEVEKTKFGGTVK